MDEQEDGFGSNTGSGKGSEEETEKGEEAKQDEEVASGTDSVTPEDDMEVDGANDDQPAPQGMGCFSNGSNMV